MAAQIAEAVADKLSLSESTCREKETTWKWFVTKKQD